MQGTWSRTSAWSASTVGEPFEATPHPRWRQQFLSWLARAAPVARRYWPMQFMCNCPHAAPTTPQ
eukprot:7004293-Alexandrium_andersonii.AAC.1